MHPPVIDSSQPSQTDSSGLGSIRSDLRSDFKACQTQADAAEVYLWIRSLNQANNWGMGHRTVCFTVVASHAISGPVQNFGTM